MPQKQQIRYPTVAERGRMDATTNRSNISNSGRGRPRKAELNYPTVAEGGRMDATKTRNRISNSDRGREGGCHKR